MVFCRGCGKELHETAPTCPQCGAPQGNLNSVIKDVTTYFKESKRKKQEEALKHKQRQEEKLKQEELNRRKQQSVGRVSDSVTRQTWYITQLSGYG
jgi:uncharacterized membrane protein YvbJ